MPNAQPARQVEVLPLGLPSQGPVARPHDEQLALVGSPVPVRVPAERWRSWLTDPGIRERFEAKRYRRDRRACWFFSGSISSTGHGSFRAASLAGPTRRGTVPAHLYAFQLEFGVIPRLGWSAANDPVLCHRCDEASCTNPFHLRLGTTAQNRGEWAQRRHNPHGPLADLRGAAGRSRAIADAIRTGLRLGESIERIRERIEQAQEAGLPLSLW